MCILADYFAPQIVLLCYYILTGIKIPWRKWRANPQGHFGECFKFASLLALYFHCILSHSTTSCHWIHWCGTLSASFESEMQRFQVWSTLRGKSGVAFCWSTWKKFVSVRHCAYSVLIKWSHLDAIWSIKALWSWTILQPWVRVPLWGYDTWYTWVSRCSPPKYPFLWQFPRFIEFKWELLWQRGFSKRFLRGIKKMHWKCMKTSQKM